MLLPPALQEWLPEGHLALFLSDGVDHALDLTPILATHATEDGRGQPPDHPALLVYASCTGTPSSRKIEPATDEEISYRALAANQHPDHDTLAAFRQTHLAAAQRGDAAEDARYGQGQRGDALPAELTRRESRLTKIREAKAALEAEAQAQAAAAKAKREARETGRKPTGRPPRISDPTQATP